LLRGENVSSEGEPSWGGFVVGEGGAGEAFDFVDDGDVEELAEGGDVFGVAGRPAWIFMASSCCGTML